MLLQFTVENYRSFKEKAILSMEASPDQDHPINLVTYGKSRVLKSAAIFGPNAAGKSTFFSAIAVALRLINKSDQRKKNEELSEVVPFIFDPSTAQAPSSFEFVFIAEDGIKYIYGFSATRKKIVSEYLYWYKTTRPSVIFERNMEEKTGFHFTNREIKKKLEPIIERNTENKLFLSTASVWNANITQNPFDWLSHNLAVTLSDPDFLVDIAMPIYEHYENVEKNLTLRTFTRRILNEADINISDYTISFGPQRNSYEIKTKHMVYNGGTEPENYSLNLIDESKGTYNLFMFSPILQQTFIQGCTLCVDELDASLHPLLVEYLIGLFHNPVVNRNHAQLIFSSHTMDLMSENIMRRDQIYFIEKDHFTAASELYSLDEFSYIKDEDRRKAYLYGLYGAVPELGLGDIEWE